MDLIFSASIIASFLAGMAALFAPCCITILLPTYLASAFQEKKNILKMTFIFFSGLAAILVPIGLGAAGLARLFSNFHKEMYLVGGFFMIFLSLMAFSGKGWALMPMSKRKVIEPGRPKVKSVFLLGIFSGAATSCCAPVLAGAVTLAVISGVFWKALIVVFAYIFGMTFPLFLMAYFYDKFKLENSRFIRGKNTNLVSAFVFLAVGLILLVLAFSGNVFWAPSFQSGLGSALNKWSQNVLGALNLLPNVFWGLVIVGFFIFLFYKILFKKKRL